MLDNTSSSETLSLETIREFQERLKILHDVSIELTKAPTLDDLCRCGVELGRSRLGFDRIGIWFIEDNLQFMCGTFGTDESGQTRDERGTRRDISTDPIVTKAIREHMPLAFEDNVMVGNHMGVPAGLGWNAMAILWDGDRCMGYMSADNLLHHRPATHHDLEILRLYGSTVGHLIVQRQAEEKLMQERLQAALQKEKVELLSEFISTLSHDLKNPLAVIKTNLYLMERLNDPEREKAKLQVIKEQTARLEKLIEDVLTMSRLEHGGQYHFEALDINTLVDEAQQKLSKDVERKSLVFALDLGKNLPPVRASKEELHRAVVNLLENAVNYTPPSGSITIRTRFDNQAIVLEINDTGIGIDKEDLPHIFDRFYRADPARMAVGGGTGLGLAIVKRIIEMHNGSITVNSRPNEGSNFHITLAPHNQPE